MEFTATEVDFGVEDLVAQLFFAEGDDDGHTLDIQASVDEPDESDLRLGMDTYYISVDEDEAVYGGVTRCAMTPEFIRLDFSESTASTFGASFVEVRFVQSADLLPDIAQQLRLIFTSGRRTEHPELEIAGIEE